MRIGDRFHLTYCSNIHAGEEWAEVDAALSAALPQIRRHLRHDEAFAVGLRLSAAAARTLESPERLRDFAAFLRDGNYYVPTINGFPYGAFHGTRVKARVYEPDWRTPERLDYSNRLARILAALNAPGAQALSISTAPGAFRDSVAGDADVEAMTHGFLRHAAILRTLREQTGVAITLAIEPEPACYIETVAEGVDFFSRHLLSPRAIARASAATGIALTADDVLTHLGLCLDACHMAVEFEDPAAAVRAVANAGIRIAKVQLSAAVRLPAPAAARATEVLAPFAEDTYLHQVVVRDGSDLTRYTDLPEALAAHPRDAAPGEWRVHFHVPIFLASLRDFETTQPYLAGLIEVLRQSDVATCLEVETYTWDVLPAEYRTTDVCTAIARELAWVRQRLAA